MEKFNNYDVSFAGLSLGTHEFEFHVTQEFFDLFDFEQEFRKPEIDLKLTLDKKNNFLDLIFQLSGKVELDCDLTNESFLNDLNSYAEIVVKFGDDYDFSDDESWIIPSAEHTINIAQMFYEMSLLAIPRKKIHPDVLSGESHSEMLDLLDQYSLTEDEGEEFFSDETSESNEYIDPRWEVLKKLKNNNN
mgnify:FL=1